MKNDLEDLLNEIRKIKKIAETEIVNVRIEIESIIGNKSANRERIETTLDHLFNLILFGVGIKEFHELNDFYSAFDPQSAKSYKRFYETMIGEKY